MSNVLALVLMINGLLLVHFGSKYLVRRFGDFHISTIVLLRMFGALTVVLLVGMAYVQQTSKDSVAALERAGDVAYRNCLQRNDTITLTNELNEARLVETRRDVEEDEADLTDLRENPPGSIEEFPIINELQDPNLVELFGILAAQSAVEYEAEIANLEEHLLDTRADLVLQEEEALAYESTTLLSDCTRDWPDAARREGVVDVDPNN
jgi:hypothetical protein